MGTAKMSHTSDDANSSDDLIAELARLMADDARGEADTTPVPAGSGTSAPAPASVQEHAPNRTPAPSLRSAPGPAPTDSPGAPRSNAALYKSGERSRDEEALHTLDEQGRRPPLKFTPTFKQPSARVNLLREAEMEEASAAPAIPVEPPAPAVPDRPRTGLFANRGGESGHFAPELPERDVHFEHDALGEIDPFSAEQGTADRENDLDAPTVPEPDIGTAEPADDPIADLIAIQLEQERNEAENAKRIDDFGHLPGGQPSAEAEDDNFAIPPVFGLGNSEISDDGAPVEATDPLEDIESLIGDAVRAGMSADEPNAAPSRAHMLEDDINDAARAAEETILAAAASMDRDSVQGSSGTSSIRNIQDVLSQHGAKPHPGIFEQEQSHKKVGWRRAIGPVVAGAVLLTIGVGLYWVFAVGTVTNEDAPVLAADNTPVKAEPETPQTDSSSGTGAVVFDELSGNTEPGNTESSSTEQLVSRDQTDGATGTEVIRVVGDETGTQASETGLANRKVRTVIVRPDGTIVNSDDVVAGGEVLPVERPDVPDLPEGTTTAASEFVNEPIITQTPVAVATAQEIADQPIATAGNALAQALAAAPVSVPVPRPRLQNRPITLPLAGVATVNTNSTGASANGNSEAVDLIASLANQTVTQPQVSATTIPVTPVQTIGSKAAAYVQLSSQRTPEAAQQSLTNIRSRFASLLTGDALEIQQVNLGERGIFFRVRMPANSIESANSVCANVKLNGGDCFVRRD